MIPYYYLFPPPPAFSVRFRWGGLTKSFSPCTLSHYPIRFLKLKMHQGSLIGSGLWMNPCKVLPTLSQAADHPPNFHTTSEPFTLQHCLGFPARNDPNRIPYFCYLAKPPSQKHRLTLVLIWTPYDILFSPEISHTGTHFSLILLPIHPPSSSCCFKIAKSQALDFKVIVNISKNLSYNLILTTTLKSLTRNLRS